MIGAEELEWAAKGHIQRTDVDRFPGLEDGESIAKIVEEMDVDAPELANCMGALINQREVDEDDLGSYSGGMLDGFIIGVRAARAEKS